MATSPDDDINDLPPNQIQALAIASLDKLQKRRRDQPAGHYNPIHDQSNPPPPKRPLQDQDQDLPPAKRQQQHREGDEEDDTSQHDQSNPPAQPQTEHPLEEQSGGGDKEVEQQGSDENAQKQNEESNDDDTDSENDAEGSNKKKKKKKQTTPKTQLSPEELRVIADKRLGKVLPLDNLGDPLPSQLLIDELKTPFRLSKIGDQNRLLKELARSFQRPARSQWGPILALNGMGGQHVSTQKAIVEAQTTVPSLEWEQRILDLASTSAADNYVQSRIALCETIRFHKLCWIPMSPDERGAQNLKFFIQAHKKTLLAPAVAAGQDLEKVCKVKYKKSVTRWVRKVREPISQGRYQLVRLFDAFGFAVLLHPCVVVQSFGRSSEKLIKVAERVGHVLKQRPAVKEAIETRDAENIKALKTLIRKLAHDDQADSVLGHLERFIDTSSRLFRATTHRQLYHTVGESRIGDLIRWIPKDKTKNGSKLNAFDLRNWRSFARPLAGIPASTAPLPTPSSSQRLPPRLFLPPPRPSSLRRSEPHRLASHPRTPSSGSAPSPSMPVSLPAPLRSHGIVSIHLQTPPGPLCPPHHPPHSSRPPCTNAAAPAPCTDPAAPAPAPNATRRSAPIAAREDASVPGLSPSILPLEPRFECESPRTTLRYGEYVAVARVSMLTLAVPSRDTLPGPSLVAFSYTSTAHIGFATFSRTHFCKRNSRSHTQDVLAPCGALSEVSRRCSKGDEGDAGAGSRSAGQETDLFASDGSAGPCQHHDDGDTHEGGSHPPTAPVPSGLVCAVTKTAMTATSMSRSRKVSVGARLSSPQYPGQPRRAYCGSASMHARDLRRREARTRIV
ncbi:hypothetical protein HMN09_01404400 [Mycena chlorophos]|uniref:Uncharacterized protein n=1 Tax=Mycena chlorophos TaxID=658473 RepID=A0A8H6VNJ9_MYCCL|nr:hypothetical protein HMN09_01404400 [Mycena chlorophos]